VFVLLEPTPEEPALPVRPVKPGIGSDSPANHSWYHSNLDRKRAEAMLRRYSKVGRPRRETVRIEST